MRRLIVLSLLVGITFSSELVQEIYQELSKQPFSAVAPLIGKMQNEAAHQPAPAPAEKGK
jgi:hypothetical protein